MTIVNELQRIENNIANSYVALEEKGATMPTVKNSDNLPSTIANLEVAGSDEILNGIIEGTVTDVELPVSITKIANNFFRGSASNLYTANTLFSLKAEGVEEVGKYVIYNQQRLNSLELPKLKRIADYGLSTGASNDSVYFYASTIKLGALEEIGQYGCQGLFNPVSTVTPTIEMSFNNCIVGNNAFMFYSLPSFDATGIKALGKSVFYNVTSNFKKIWLPKTIETISTTGTTSTTSLFNKASVTIYTDVTDENSIPSGWGTGWNYSAGTKLTVVYGATHEEFLNAEV